MSFTETFPNIYYAVRIVTTSKINICWAYTLWNTVLSIEKGFPFNTKLFHVYFLIKIEVNMIEMIKPQIYYPCSNIPQIHKC